MTKKDKIRNVQIVQNVQLVEIERNKLSWYDQVMRRNEEKKTKKYLQWRPTGKRPVGQPRKR